MVPKTRPEGRAARVRREGLRQVEPRLLDVVTVTGVDDEVVRADRGKVDLVGEVDTERHRVGVRDTVGLRRPGVVGAVLREADRGDLGRRQREVRLEAIGDGGAGVGVTREVGDVGGEPDLAPAEHRERALRLAAVVPLGRQRQHRVGVEGDLELAVAVVVGHVDRVLDDAQEVSRGEAADVVVMARVVAQAQGQRVCHASDARQVVRSAVGLDRELDRCVTGACIGAPDHDLGEVGAERRLEPIKRGDRIRQVYLEETLCGDQ